MAKGRRYPPEPLTHPEVVAILGACQETPYGVRDRALYATLYRAGLRISEALALSPKDLEPFGSGAQLRVLHGKGDKSRVAAIDAWGWEYLKNWLEARVDLGIPLSAPVFCSLIAPFGAIGYQQAMEKLLELGKKAGVAKRIHLHGLRHTMASQLLRENVPIPTIQAQLGHSSPLTTVTYLQKVSPEQMLRDIVARPQPEE